MNTVLKIKRAPSLKVVDKGYSKEDLIGPQGAEGHKGLTGDMGAAGAAGSQGATGAAGREGKQGTAGVTGTPGATGVDGQMGMTGPQGERGPMPLHDTRGDAIRFEIATGVWGKWIKLSGMQMQSSNGMSLGGKITVEPVTEVVTVISTEHVVTTEDIILVNDDSAGAEVTIFLPEPVDGATHYIKKIGSSHNVVVDSEDTEVLIDNGTQAPLTIQNEAIKVAADGTNWWIL